MFTPVNNKTIDEESKYFKGNKFFLSEETKEDKVKRLKK